MKHYTIYCTPEQTKKALELGAPIERDGYEDRPYVYIDGAYLIPTTEQMIGWLEGQGIHVDICYESDNRFYYVFDFDDFVSDFYPTRKEATLAAIDAALGYLINKK